MKNARGIHGFLNSLSLPQSALQDGKTYRESKRRVGFTDLLTSEEAQKGGAKSDPA
jgi:hypothetical protein